jgi:hypothetical protein
LQNNFSAVEFRATPRAKSRALQATGTSTPTVSLDPIS